MREIERFTIRGKEIVYYGPEMGDFVSQLPDHRSDVLDPESGQCPNTSGGSVRSVIPTRMTVDCITPGCNNTLILTWFPQRVEE